MGYKAYYASRHGISWRGGSSGVVVGPKRHISWLMGCLLLAFDYCFRSRCSCCRTCICIIAWSVSCSCNAVRRALPLPPPLPAWRAGSGGDAHSKRSAGKVWTGEKGGLIPPFIARDVNPVLLFSRQVPFQAYPYCLLTRVLLPPPSGSCVGLALGRAP